MENGVPADTFLLPPYAPLPVLEYAPTTIVSQTKRREQWLDDRFFKCPETLDFARFGF